MPKCVFKKRVDTKICSGDMDRQILVETRSITPPPDDNTVDYDETFVSFQSFWAMIETVKGETVFDSSNVERVVTHKFYVRFVPDLTFEKWVKYNQEKYRIVDVQNFNERNEFYLLRCSLRGDENLGVNLQ